MDKHKVMFILHAYQPPYPIQSREVVKRIIDNCYKPIMKKWDEFDNVKVVLNINASLTEILMEEAPIIIELLRKLVKLGKVELIESGAYHPIFPLISQNHSKIQIETNHKINKQAFGNIYKPSGFWPPELAINDGIYSPDISFYYHLS